MKTNQVIELIKNAEKKFFVGALSDTKISNIEEKLNVKLPDSYKWFLREYGTGGVIGVEILGGGLRDIPTCVTETVDWRGYGLPEEFVVIENFGAGVYCLDTSRIENGECPVVDWEQGEGVGTQEYNDFLSFLIERFSNR
ncbi:SMI1/KNR4 family protein [Brevibacillus agri]|uniref:SMI1/KNR4 family protein n=1 Tax=Brevibacillus agri TaxID=51101 RepID=UPI0024C0383B|nr:SMI1/KNR4 family protein [Brevibacillus agri]MED4567969.1 SMI1/KNR4 family protein [Brevibacillus agri]WHX29488.1 SMI1/KNR4 family protein [Brevibacillus agri]